MLIEIYKEILELYDFDVQTASNMNEGIEKYKITDPDLVIMEIDMPENNGHDALKKITEIDKDANIVIITRDLESFSKKYQMGNKLREIFLKPVLATELVKLTKKYTTKFDTVKVRNDFLEEITIMTDKFLKEFNKKLSSNKFEN